MYKLLSLLILFMPFYCLGQPSVSWEKTYGGSGLDRAFFINTTKDGGFIAIGNTASSDGDIQHKPENNGNDVWIIETDSAWNLLRERSFGGSRGDVGYKIFPTADNGYIVLAATGSNDGDVVGGTGMFGDVWAIKLDSDLNLEWNQAYGNLSKLLRQKSRSMS